MSGERARRLAGWALLVATGSSLACLNLPRAANPLAEYPCRRAADCLPGWTCADDRCRPACESNDECPQSTCCADGACQPCVSENDGPAGGDPWAPADPVEPDDADAGGDAGSDAGDGDGAVDPCASPDACVPYAGRTCGDCGTQTCSESCVWSECLGQGCHPGAERECGACNEGKEHCTAECTWGLCLGARCAPSESKSCGDCGNGMQICDGTCNWGPCSGPGCDGSTLVKCTPCTAGSRRCRADCTWSACVGPTCVPGTCVQQECCTGPYGNAGCSEICCTATCDLVETGCMVSGPGCQACITRGVLNCSVGACNN